MKPRVIGKGLQEKRARLLRSLDAHLRWLRVAETLGPWTPPVREPHAEWPRRMARYRGLPEYVYPVERPELARRAPRPEDLSAAAVQAWVDAHPFVRSGLQEATQRAMAYLETFAPPTRAPRGATAPAPGDWLITGQEIQRKSYVVKESRYWKSDITRLTPRPDPAA